MMDCSLPEGRKAGSDCDSQTNTTRLTYIMYGQHAMGKAYKSELCPSNIVVVSLMFRMNAPATSSSIVFFDSHGLRH